MQWFLVSENYLLGTIKTNYKWSLLPKTEFKKPSYLLHRNCKPETPSAGCHSDITGRVMSWTGGPKVRQRNFRQQTSMCV